jgi:hypothetical protein
MHQSSTTYACFYTAKLIRLQSSFKSNFMAVSYLTSALFLFPFHYKRTVVCLRSQFSVMSCLSLSDCLVLSPTPSFLHLSPGVPYSHVSLYFTDACLLTHVFFLPFFLSFICISPPSVIVSTSHSFFHFLALLLRVTSLSSSLFLYWLVVLCL